MMSKRVAFVFILFLLAVVFFSFSIDLARVKRGGFFSDESTYYAIMQSLAHDGDLRYERRDIQRIRETFWVGPMGLFLKKGQDGRYYYAKSFIYPLLAAPFFRLFGVHGILLANGLMLLLVLLMGFRLLRQHHPERQSLAFTFTYVFASVTFVYVWWTTADLFNFFVNFAALFFFFYRFRRPAWGYLAAPLFAAAVFSKPNNILHIGMLFLLLLARREWKRFAVLALASIVFLGGLVAFNYAQTGEFNYQGGERRSFYGSFPLERDDHDFEAGQRMTADNYWSRFYLSPVIAAYNLFYYFFGRFTGMIIYFFPALLLLLLFALQPKEREDWFLLAGIAAAILCYVLLTPDNYFGGGGSLGNRYFLNIFPLFFFLGYRRRDFRFTWVALVAAAVFLAPVYTDALSHSATPRYPGLAFPARLFPVEKTQYAALPSNTNPRSFNRRINDEFTLFMVSDSYYPIEGSTFWTYADRELEFFLLAPKSVRAFAVQLKNPPQPNYASVAIEHKRSQVFIGPGQVRTVLFRGVPGLAIGERRLYAFKVRSARSYFPYYQEPGSRDQRLLGVEVGIQLQY